MHETDRRAHEILQVKDDVYQLSQTVRGHDIINHENTAKTNTLFRNLKDKLKHIEGNQRDIENINLNLRSEIMKYNQFILEHKVYYNTKLEQITSQHSDDVSDIKSRINNLILKDTFKEGIVQRQREDINTLFTDIGILKGKLESDEEQLMDCVNFKRVFTSTLGTSGTANSFLNQLAAKETPEDRNSHDIKMISNRITELEKELRKTDNYIEKQLPLRYVTAIGEIIDYTISSKPVREKLKEYMDYKLTELNEIIEKDKGWPSLSKVLEKVKIGVFKYNELTINDLLQSLRDKAGNTSKKFKSTKAFMKKNTMKFSSQFTMHRDLVAPKSVKNRRIGAFSQGKGSFRSESQRDDDEDFANRVQKVIKSDIQPNGTHDEAVSSKSMTSFSELLTQNVEKHAKEDSEKESEKVNIKLEEKSQISRSEATTRLMKKVTWTDEQFKQENRLKDYSKENSPNSMANLGKLQATKGELAMLRQSKSAGLNVKTSGNRIKLSFKDLSAQLNPNLLNPNDIQTTKSAQYRSKSAESRKGEQQNTTKGGSARGLNSQRNSVDGELETKTLQIPDQEVSSSVSDDETPPRYNPLFNKHKSEVLEPSPVQIPLINVSSLNTGIHESKTLNFSNLVSTPLGDKENHEEQKSKVKGEFESQSESSPFVNKLLKKVEIDHKGKAIEPIEEESPEHKATYTSEEETSESASSSEEGKIIKKQL